MPLETYKRGGYYWVKGRAECNGGPITSTSGEARRHLQKQAHGTGYPVRLSCKYAVVLSTMSRLKLFPTQS